jgi:hypothetical protein
MFAVCETMSVTLPCNANRNPMEKALMHAHVKSVFITISADEQHIAVKIVGDHV